MFKYIKWGLGIGDWGLGIGPNPQSPIPIFKIKIIKLELIIKKLLFKQKNNKNIILKVILNGYDDFVLDQSLNHHLNSKFFKVILFIFSLDKIII